MAIAFVRAKIIGRSTGQSAVACAAYRSGDKLHDERYGKQFDYGRKAGIVASGIAAPEAAPEWVRNRERLWNAVEAAESRKDARLAREFIVALPAEVEPGDRLYIIYKAADYLAAQGMVVDWAVHEPNSRGDDRNYHAHLLATTREMTAEGFGSKAKGSVSREWNSEEWLTKTKGAFLDNINEVLRRNGKPEIAFEERNGQGLGHLGPERTGEIRRLAQGIAQLQRETESALALLEQEKASLLRGVEIVQPPVSGMAHELSREFDANYKSSRPNKTFTESLVLDTKLALALAETEEPSKVRMANDWSRDTKRTLIASERRRLARVEASIEYADQQAKKRVADLFRHLGIVSLMDRIRGIYRRIIKPDRDRER